MGKLSPLPVRGQRLDELAEALPQRASALLRLFLSNSSLGISRTEAGVLSALSQRPWRITELAAREGVTQPAISLLVNRLAERGWVYRKTDLNDRRVVLVELTETGRAVFEQMRAEYRALLHEDMAMLPDQDVDTLARAVEILDELIERLDGRER